MRAALPLLFLGVIASAPVLAYGNPHHAIRCNKLAGFRGKPIVPDARTARAIFLAVERAVFPQADKENYPLVEANEEGGQWTVFRTARVREARSDLVTEVTIVAGGGQLGLDLDKCSGAVTHAALQK